MAADSVALVCGTKISQDNWQIGVVIGGPTTSTEISGFSFDVVFPAADLSYVAGSAALGPLLSQGGNTPLLVAQLASNDPGRLVVGIERTGPAPGVQGTASQNLILTFRLKTNAIVSFGPDLIRFENAEAVDSSKAPIAGIDFSDQLLLSVN